MYTTDLDISIKYHKRLKKRCSMTFSFKLISFNFIQILLKSLVKTLIKIIQQNNIEKECSENFLIGISKQYFMEGRMHYLKAIRRKMSRGRL